MNQRLLQNATIFHKNAIFWLSYFANAAMKPAIEHRIPDKRTMIYDIR